MAQPLRELAALPENAGWIPSTHVEAHDNVYLQTQEIHPPLDILSTRQAQGAQIYMQANTHP